MVQAIINISEKANRVINIVKAKHGLKDKSQAINVMAEEYEESVMEPQLRPEYIKKLQKIQKQKAISFKNIDELRKIIEG